MLALITAGATKGIGKSNCGSHSDEGHDIIAIFLIL